MKEGNKVKERRKVEGEKGRRVREKVVQKWQNLIMKIRIISDKMIETRKGEEDVIFVKIKLVKKANRINVNFIPPSLRTH